MRSPCTASSADASQLTSALASSSQLPLHWTVALPGSTDASQRGCAWSVRLHVDFALRRLGGDGQPPSTLASNCAFNPASSEVAASMPKSALDRRQLRVDARADVVGLGLEVQHRLEERVDRHYAGDRCVAVDDAGLRNRPNHSPPPDHGCRKRCLLSCDCLRSLAALWRSLLRCPLLATRQRRPSKASDDESVVSRPTSPRSKLIMINPFLPRHTMRATLLGTASGPKGRVSSHGLERAGNIRTESHAHSSAPPTQGARHA